MPYLFSPEREDRPPGSVLLAILAAYVAVAGLLAWGLWVLIFR